MSIGIPAGQPLMVTPMATPCDSPKVVMLKIFPKIFPMNDRVIIYG
jgi:hypothetical protein